MLDGYRNEEYTGANRCYPCTVANLSVLFGICTIVALRSWLLAIPVCTIGVAAISLRGYLIPYTPRLVPHLKQTVVSVMTQSDSPPPEPTSLSDDDVPGERIVDEFLRADILTAANGDDLELSPTFEETWQAVLADIPTHSVTEFERWATENIDKYEIADIDVINQRWGDPYVVVLFESDDEITLPYPIAIAELTALKALTTTDTSETLRLHGVGPLRAFLEHCPKCNSPLEISTYTGCCGNPNADEEAPGLVCPECRDFFFKYPS